jgi:DNA-binding NtrC family response regulator
MWPLKWQHSDGCTVRASRVPIGVLAILAEPRDAQLLIELANSQRWDLTVVHALDQAALRVAHETFSIILLDRDVASSDWRSPVRTFAQLQPAPSVILISPVADHYLFDELVKQGGFEVIAKPLQADELHRIARLAVAFWKSRRGQRG